MMADNSGRSKKVSLAKASPAPDDLRRDAVHLLLGHLESDSSRILGCEDLAASQPTDPIRIGRFALPEAVRRGTRAIFRRRHAHPPLEHLAGKPDVDITDRRCEPPAPGKVRHLARRHVRLAARTWRSGAQQDAAWMSNSSVHRQIAAAIMPGAERRRIDASRGRRIRSGGERASFDRRDDRLFLTARRMKRQQKCCA